MPVKSILVIRSLGRTCTRNKHILYLKFCALIRLFRYCCIEIHKGVNEHICEPAAGIGNTMKFTMMCKKCGVCKTMDESDKTIAVVLCALLFGIGFFFLNVAVYQYVRKEKSSCGAAAAAAVDDGFASNESGRSKFIQL